MNLSSSFKVGILTLIALVVLLLTIFWAQGRAFSNADRIEVIFKDVNGMRPGSGVQMMGLRVGQVEEIIPVVEDGKSYVKLRFVITEKGVSIPKASSLSIQQSGLIGEQFLEITPPKTRTVYVPMIQRSLLFKDDKVQIKLDGKYHDVGYVKNTQVMSTSTLPLKFRENIHTQYAYKIDYIVNLPGLILPEFLKGSIVNDGKVKKLRIAPLDDSPLPYPEQNSLYTIIEPMRISDFMDWQYKAAESLTETNKKINDLLSDDVIADLKQSVININELTAQATTTVAKAEKLLDASQKDLDQMMAMMNSITKDFNKITNDVNTVIGDPKFKPVLYDTATSINRLSNNLSNVLEQTDSKVIAEDLTVIMTNVSDITTYVNNMTKDDKVKKELSTAVTNINKAMSDISSALEVVNSLPADKKKEVSCILSDVAVSTANLRKFSEKLNKRFLLFRLMF